MSPPATTAQATLLPPKSGVTVRMYNPGFGDCLLLAFRGDDGKARYMLIDCGVHHNYPGGEERTRLVASDIAKATGKHLHVVVATHEHTDHLYGFMYAREVFKTIRIDRLWLAWTEDPTNPTAAKLKQLYGIQLRALTTAANLLEREKKPLGTALRGVLGFEFPNALAATGGNAAQLAFLREKSAKKLLGPQDYCHPKAAPLSLSGVKGVKVYVLGPPEDVKLISRLEDSSELYPELAALNEAGAFAFAALAAAGPLEDLEEEDKQLFDSTLPFGPPVGITQDKAREDPFFQETYGFSDAPGQGPSWRRIDTDWLATSEQLALSINAKTNNTSLALAIELPGAPHGKVLLFAADAQVGNWLSWQKLTWPGDGPGAEPVKATDLLARTVLYKVGHHGSRNATLRSKGLEMMTSSDLVAMIPVDEEWANGIQGWEHPAHKLLARLLDRTSGRILRSDKIPTGDNPPSKPQNTPKTVWQEFVKQIEWDRGPDRLWIQYTVLA